MIHNVGAQDIVKTGAEVEWGIIVEEEPIR